MKNQTEYQMLLQDEHLQIINFDNIKKELKQLNDDILEVTAKPTKHLRNDLISSV